MTIAIGMLCAEGVIFGADTEETIGEMRGRVHKIPTKTEGQRVMVTGACENGHLMDTAVERIFDGLGPEEAKTTESVGAFLQKTMLSLYRRDFKIYPDQNSTRMRLLVASKPQEESKVAAWSIDCSSVHRMRPMEIAGCGELVRFVGDHLYTPYMALESGKVAMVQVLSAAKKMVQYVGGDSYVHVLRDGGGYEMKNFCFSPEVEDLYESFFVQGRGLLLATGNKTIPDTDFERIATEFIANLRWKRAQVREE